MKKQIDEIKYDIVGAALDNLDGLKHNILNTCIDKNNTVIFKRTQECLEEYLRKCSEALFEFYNRPETLGIYEKIQTQKIFYEDAVKSSTEGKVKELTFAYIYLILLNALFDKEATEQEIYEMRMYQAETIGNALIEIGIAK